MFILRLVGTVLKFTFFMVFGLIGWLILIFAVGTQYPALGAIFAGLFVLWVISRKRQ
jgi:hypothetical protein